MAEKDKKKRKHLPPRGDLKVVSSVPDRARPIEEREEFGETTFAGALEQVKRVLEQAGTPEGAPPKGRKKG